MIGTVFGLVSAVIRRPRPQRANHRNNAQMRRTLDELNKRQEEELERWQSEQQLSCFFEFSHHTIGCSRRTDEEHERNMNARQEEIRRRRRELLGD